MGEPDVRTTLDAVRRHLWREHGRLAVRRAGWLSAATMLLAAAVHLIALPMPAGAVLWLVAIEWAALLASAAWRRPSDADCALWIDRHLGGASAFTTLLDPGPNPQAPANAQSLRWLERWVAAKVPGVLRSLEERRPSVRVARSLLAMVVCSTLALFVLSLSDTMPSAARRASAAQAVASGDPSTPSIEAPVAAQLAGDIATALRSTDLPSEPQRRRGGDTSAAGPTRADDGPMPPSASPATLVPADAPLAQPDSRSLATVEGGVSAGRGRSAGALSGHDAGDSPDARADPGVSRAATGTIAQPRSASTLRGAGAERQADMEQAAGFDESASPPGGARPGAEVAAAAAAPPRAVAAARLSATETSYVEAWMKATGRSR